MLEDNTDKSGFQLVEIQNYIGPSPKDKATSYIQSAITSGQNRLDVLENFVLRDMGKNISCIFSMYRRDLLGFSQKLYDDIGANLVQFL